MREASAGDEHRVVAMIEKHGRCLELIPMDPRFQDISVGIYRKNDVLTLCTFSRKPGVSERRPGYRSFYSPAARLTHTNSLSLRANKCRLAKAGWLHTTSRPYAPLVGSKTWKRLIGS